MKIIAKTGNPDLATVYLARMNNGKIIEFVESVQPPFPREEKWVLIVSSLFGCPVRCLMCDANEQYHGKLSAEEILWQIDYLVKQHFSDKNILCKKFKIQFARMGEPAFNLAVLDVLTMLPNKYNAAGLMPSISTVAPVNCQEFFKNLVAIKNDLYGNGRFQMQFSIHTTNEHKRQQLIPIKTWSLEQIAAYGDVFYRSGDRKIALNFALIDGFELNAHVLKNYFDPDKFLIKITPLNPTLNASKNKLQSFISEDSDCESRVAELLSTLKDEGYEVILSIGEYEENKIGSNCGQYLNRYFQTQQKIANAYQYPKEDIETMT